MRVRKNSIAKYLDHALKHSFTPFCDAEEIINRLFYEFSMLHGIGVAVKEKTDRIIYEFMCFPERIDHEWRESRKATCRSTAIVIDFMQFNRSDANNVIRQLMIDVERELYLAHWEDYLEEKPKDDNPVTSSVWTDDSKAPVDAISDRIRYEVKQQMRLLTNSVYGIPKKPDEMYYLVSRGFGKSTWANQAAIAYCKNDVIATRNLHNAFNTNNIKITFDIEQVIFNDPATIVIFKDGTKTVVKAQDGELYDPEKGLAMALCKKTMGNTRDYYNVFLKYLKQWKKENPEKEEAIEAVEIYERLYNFVTLHELTMVSYTPDDPDYRHRIDCEITDGHTTMTLTKIPVRGTIQELNKIEKAIYEFFKL